MNPGPHGAEPCMQIHMLTRYPAGGGRPGAQVSSEQKTRRRATKNIRVPSSRSLARLCGLWARSHPARFFSLCPICLLLEPQGCSLSLGRVCPLSPPCLQLQISPCTEEDRGRVFPGSPGTQPPELTCSLKALDSVTASQKH